MNQKIKLLPNVRPGWTLTENLVEVDGKWARVAVEALGPQHPLGRWKKLFQGDDAEAQARAFMRERNGVDPASA